MKNFEFKTMTSNDLKMLKEWLSKDHVKEFWKEDLRKNKTFEKKYLEKISSSEIDPFIVYLQGKPIGFIQSYQTKVKGVVGIDQFIGIEEFVNKGIGSLFIKEFTEELFKNKSVVKVVADPEIDNKRAQRSLQKAGFKFTESKNKKSNLVLMEKEF